jgi:hypothetical protein
VARQPWAPSRVVQSQVDESLAAEQPVAEPLAVKLRLESVGSAVRGTLAKVRVPVLGLARWVFGRVNSIEVTAWSLDLQMQP